MSGDDKDIAGKLQEPDTIKRGFASAYRNFEMLESAENAKDFVAASKRLQELVDDPKDNVKLTALAQSSLLRSNKPDAGEIEAVASRAYALAQKERPRADKTRDKEVVNTSISTTKDARGVDKAQVTMVTHSADYAKIKHFIVGVEADNVYLEEVNGTRNEDGEMPRTYIDLSSGHAALDFSGITSGKTVEIGFMDGVASALKKNGVDKLLFTNTEKRVIDYNVPGQTKAKSRGAGRKIDTSKDKYEDPTLSVDRNSFVDNSDDINLQLLEAKGEVAQLREEEKRNQVLDKVDRDIAFNGGGASAKNNTQNTVYVNTAGNDTPEKKPSTGGDDAPENQPSSGSGMFAAIGGGVAALVGFMAGGPVAALIVGGVAAVGAYFAAPMINNYFNPPTENPQSGLPEQPKLTGKHLVDNPEALQQLDQDNDQHVDDLELTTRLQADLGKKNVRSELKELQNDLVKAGVSRKDGYFDISELNSPTNVVAANANKDVGRT